VKRYWHDQELDEAIAKLETEDHTKAQLVKLCHFAPDVSAVAFNGRNYRKGTYYHTILEVPSLRGTVFTLSESPVDGNAKSICGWTQ
jgi:hypothetical protein